MANEQLIARRNRHQLRDGVPFIADYEAACAYVEELGIVMPWSAKGYPLPCLRTVFRGEVKREPGPIWDWKDQMPLEKRAYYGALLRHGKVLLAPRLAPAFYRASGRTGAAEDYLSDYEEGTLPRTSKQIVDILSDGPCQTPGLRTRLKQVGADTSRLQQELDELQARFYVTKAGVTPGGGYLWGLVDEGWPELPASARGWTKPEARADVVVALLHAAVFLRPADIERMTGWGKQRVDQVLDALSRRGRIVRAGDDAYVLA
ncbi:MAG: DNA glycosylase AlkZ-like family protein [Chloroflexota bacterium]